MLPETCTAFALSFFIATSKNLEKCFEDKSTSHSDRLLKQIFENGLTHLAGPTPMPYEYVFSLLTIHYM